MKPVRKAWIAAGLFIFAFAAHFPSLRGGFTNWDDPAYVTANQRIRSVTAANVLDILNPALTRSDPFPEYQPVRDLSFALDYAVWGGNPLGFHLTNLLLHAANAALLFWFFSLLFPFPRVAAAAALLFACHPVHVESVAWVSSRKDLLGLFFTLLSGICFLKGGFKKSLLFFILALFSKSHAVTLPALLAAHAVWDGRKPKALIPFFAAAAVYAAHFLFIQFGRRPLADFYAAGFEPNPAAIVQVFARYAGMIVAPLRLSPVYEINEQLKIVDWRFFTALGWTAVFAFTAVLFWRRKNPAGVCMVMFAVQLFPVLNFLPHPIWIADRYLYFAAPFAYWPLAYGAEKLLGKNRRAAAVFAVVAVVSLSLLTFRQTRLWKNSETLWAGVLERYPDSARARVNLANGLREAGKREEAETRIAAWLAGNPDDFQLWTELGNVQFERGRLAAALESYRMAAGKGPEEGAAHYNVAKTLQVLKRPGEAEKIYRACTAFKTPFPPCYEGLGVLLAEKGDYVRAKESFLKAIELKPDYTEALYDLGVLSAKARDWDAAARYFREVLAYDSGHTRAAEALRISVSAQAPLQ